MKIKNIDKRIFSIVNESIEIKEIFFKNNYEKIIDVVTEITSCFQNNGKMLLFGNGGSSSDAQHIAAEFINRFLVDRDPLPAISLTTNPAAITSIGNDYCFEEIFSRQIDALGNPGDISLGISTSGNSQNVIIALRKAKEKGMFTIGFGGNSGGKMKDECDICLIINSDKTPRIQEIHLILGHIICELVEEAIILSQVKKNNNTFEKINRKII